MTAVFVSSRLWRALGPPPSTGLAATRLIFCTYTFYPEAAFVSTSTESVATKADELDLCTLKAEYPARKLPETPKIWALHIKSVLQLV